MSHTLFIADLHLSEDRPDITAAFTTFMREQAVNADALYVLGDLFEAWIGDDDKSAFNQQIIGEFAQLTSNSVPVYFIHGNRDFLIGKTFAKQSGITLLPEHKVIDLYGTPTLIMHGDTLCTNDLVYQKFRKKSRGWWWPRLMLTMPLSYRQKVARNARAKSKEHNKNTPEYIMDVTPEEVTKVMQEYKVQRLIHGHTHRPNRHQIQVNNQSGERVVVGDWYSQSSVLTVTPDALTLVAENLLPN